MVDVRREDAGEKEGNSVRAVRRIERAGRMFAFEGWGRIGKWGHGVDFLSFTGKFWGWGLVPEA